MLATRTLEFDRIVDAVTALALTPLGSAALSSSSRRAIRRSSSSLQAATTETVKFLERHPLFPLRAGEGLARGARRARRARPAARAARSSGCSPTSSTRSIVAAPAFAPRRRRLPHPARARRRTSPPSRAKSQAVRQAIDPGGEVLDSASPELKRIRNELRQKRQKLRGTLEQFTRGSSVEVPAGRGRDRAQRTVRADGARRTSRQRARHRARLAPRPARRCFSNRPPRSRSTTTSSSSRIASARRFSASCSS